MKLLYRVVYKKEKLPNTTHPIKKKKKNKTNKYNYFRISVLVLFIQIFGWNVIFSCMCAEHIVFSNNNLLGNFIALVNDQFSCAVLCWLFSFLHKWHLFNLNVKRISKHKRGLNTMALNSKLVSELYLLRSSMVILGPFQDKFVWKKFQQFFRLNSNGKLQYNYVIV